MTDITPERVRALLKNLEPDEYLMRQDSIDLARAYLDMAARVEELERGDLKTSPATRKSAAIGETVSVSTGFIGVLHEVEIKPTKAEDE